MKTLLVLFAVSATVLGAPCNVAEDCGAPAVHAKCVDKKCVFIPINNKVDNALHQIVRNIRKACRVSHDCDDQSTCIDGKCVVNNGSGGACSSDAFCPDGYICVDSNCQVFKRRLVADCPEDCKMPACQC